MLTQTYDLSIIPSRSIVKVHASQWEDGERKFIFNLYDASGLYSIASGAVVEVRGTKADGHGFAVSNSTHPAYISYSGSVVNVITMKQMCAAAGEQDFKISITISGKQIASARFTLVVDEDTLNDDTDTSDSVLPAIIDAARTSAAQAAVSATAAAASATAAAGSATQAANSAQAAASSESNAATSESSAAQSASDAEDAADRAEAYSINTPYIGANGNWWVWNTTTGAYVDTGVDASITLQIADITMLDASATPYVTNTGTNTDPIFHLFIPRGIGISSVTKTGTSGLVDTYTINYSDGTATTFTVTNGKTAYQSAVESGYTGTETEFNAALSHFEEWKDDAEDAATAATTAKNAAQASANDAQESAAQAAAYAGMVIPTFYIDFTTMELMQREQPTASDITFTLDENKHLKYEIATT